MKTYPLAYHRLAASLLLSLTIPALAQVVPLGGKPQPGFARPPLYVNLNPHDATSNYGPYSPAQIRHAYGVDLLLGQSITGSGQKIGIVDAYGDTSIQTDLNNFCNYYGIPSTTVTVLGASGRNSSWGLETALDVEWAHAIAPNASIILSVARSASLSDLLAAVDAAVQAGATVVSMSWGAQETTGINLNDRHFQVPNVTFVASSGDSSELTNTSSTSFEVDWPASSPYVVGVGGTTLYLDSSGNRLAPTSETAWSGSGGGISGVYQGVPSWQTVWQTFGWRTVPDVSYVADPNTGVGVAYGRYLYEVGGTSVGAPQWSALIALANQSRTTTLSGNPNIYAAAGTPGTHNSDFVDIISGSNGSDGDDSAATGYDLVTGLGSPVANNLVPALGEPSPDFTLSISPASQAIIPGATATYTVTVGFVGGFGDSVNLTVSGQPGDATVGFQQQSFSSGGSTTLTVATSTAGTYTLTVTGTDKTSGVTHSVTATLVVGKPDFSIAATPSSATVRHGRSTTYTVTVTYENGLTGTVALSASGLPSGATYTFSPSSVNSSGSSTLQINTSSTTPRGTYPIKITGTSSTTHDTTVTLTVN